MNNKKKETQLDLLMEYFKKNPCRDIPHPEIVDWAVPEWQKRTGTIFRDPDRGIRQLHQQSFLIKVQKGIYHYNPKQANLRKLEEFSAKQKKRILERDNYKCTMCGRGNKDGMELHVDHIKAKDLGGRAIIENGQTLCSQHNFLKKNLNQTESGKKMFILLHELAGKENNQELEKFSREILKIYEKHNINGHIEWHE